MKFIIEVDILLKALIDVHGIAEKKPINPILSNIMLTTKNNSLIISATDTILYITEVVNTVEILKEGATTVPLFQLLDTIKKLKPKERITLNLEDKHLFLECNGFKGNLPVIPADSFPENYNGKYDTTFTIPCDSLKFLINKTKFAICLDETRFYLNGIYLHHGKDENDQSVLKAVATDGHKLAYATTALPNGADSLKGLIIPKKTVEELYKILEKYESDNVDVLINVNLIVFKFLNLTLSSNLIDGNFPEYNKVIPVDIKHSVSINTKELIETIDLVSIFSDYKIRTIKLHINGNTLTIKAAKEDGLYSGEKVINLESSYKEFIISFNSRYLLDILTLVDQEDVCLNLTTNTSPVLINTSENKNYLFVLMPMRV